MKALLLTGKNNAPEIREIDDCIAGPGQAVVQIHASSLNHRDVWIQKGQYAGLKYPVVPGSDGAGVVVQVGAAVGAGAGVGAAGVGAAAWLNKQVIINPALHWGSDPAYQDPAGFSILGLPDNGTIAGYVKVPVENLVEKPHGLTFDQAAALPLAGVTAYRALMTRARVRAGEKVLITGIGGGVALFAFQFALAVGAKVYVTSGSEEKIQKAMAMGAQGAANYQHAGWGDSLKALAGGFDVTIDGAAGDGLDTLFDLAAPGGRVVIYGATRGNPSALVARRIFWKQLTVLGSTMGSPEDFRSMVDFVNQHQIRPVVDKVFPFEESPAAFQWMDDARQFGKIVIGPAISSLLP
jgi:zinc-binding alcohol dehydrogenase/oxidoreductase